MNDLRTAAQQAIGLICRARLCEVNSMSSRQEMLRLLIEAIDTLRAALAQQAEPAKTFLITGNEFCGAPPAPYATWGDALAGMLDAGKIEGLRISAQAAQAELEQLRAENARLAREAHTWWTALAGATAEIEQWRRSAGCVRAEPVRTVRVDAGEVHIIPAIRDADRSALKDGQAVYAAPPQRKPLTVEEILEMAEKAWTPSVYCDAEALLGTDGLVALVRAVERAHNIKE